MKAKTHRLLLDWLPPILSRLFGLTAEIHGDFASFEDAQKYADEFNGRTKERNT